MKQKTAMTQLLEAIEYLKEVTNKQGEPYFNMVKVVAENLRDTTERGQIEEAGNTCGNMLIANEIQIMGDQSKTVGENYYQQKYGDEK